MACGNLVGADFECLLLQITMNIYKKMYYYTACRLCCLLPFIICRFNKIRYYSLFAGTWYFFIICKSQLKRKKCIFCNKYIW